MKTINEVSKEINILQESVNKLIRDFQKENPLVEIEVTVLELSSDQMPHSMPLLAFGAKILP